MAQYYVDGKPVPDKLEVSVFENPDRNTSRSMTIRCGHSTWHRRKLKPYFKDGKMPITAWRRERERLEQEYKDIQTELSPLYADVKGSGPFTTTSMKCSMSRAAANTTAQPQKRNRIMRKESYMGKIISIDEINRAVMEGKDDLVFELCKVFDHESYFDPIFDPPESFLQECAALLEQAKPLLQNRGAQDWKHVVHH